MLCNSSRAVNKVLGLVGSIIVSNLVTRLVICWKRESRSFSFSIVFELEDGVPDDAFASSRGDDPLPVPLDRLPVLTPLPLVGVDRGFVVCGVVSVRGGVRAGLPVGADDGLEPEEGVCVCELPGVLVLVGVPMILTSREDGVV
jgi:hypothetical protein